MRTCMHLELVSTSTARAGFLGLARQEPRTAASTSGASSAPPWVVVGRLASVADEL